MDSVKQIVESIETKFGKGSIEKLISEIKNGNVKSEPPNIEVEPKTLLDFTKISEDDVSEICSLCMPSHFIFIELCDYDVFIYEREQRCIKKIFKSQYIMTGDIDYYVIRIYENLDISVSYLDGSVSFYPRNQVKIQKILSKKYINL